MFDKGNGMVGMSRKLINILSIIYMYVPLILFVGSWTKMGVAIVVVGTAMIAIVLCCRDIVGEEAGGQKIPWIDIFFVFLFFLVLCVFCGQGDLFRQDYDWNKHHAILRDLMNYDYPVIYEGNVMLTYYLGQYMVPALCGKLFGHSYFVMKWTVPLWNAIGMTLAALLLFQYVKANRRGKRIAVVVAMVFFAGAFYLGSFVYQDVLGHEVMYDSFKWLDSERVKVHFPSNFDAFYGDFQHVIIPWIGTALFLQRKRKMSHYMVYAVPLLFSATFGFVYFAVILVTEAAVELIHNFNKKASWSSLFAIQNWLMLPMIGTLGIYYLGNILSEKPGTTGFSINNMFAMMDYYIIFILAEFGIYYIILWKFKHSDSIYWITLIELIIIPFFSMGRYNDLCSRGSIPARFILMAFVIDFLINGKHDYIRKSLLAAFLLVGAINVVSEMRMIWQDTRQYGMATEMNIHDSFGTLNGMSGNPDVREDEAYNYFTTDYQHSLFYKIARKNKG